MLLIGLPFIPFAFALELTQDRKILNSVLIAGLAVAGPWFLYVIWRMGESVVRSFRDAAPIFRMRELNRRERIQRIVSGVIIILLVFICLRWFENPN